jgi:hypothetical protein
MGPIQTLGQAITGPLADLWERFANYFPLLVGALLVFFLGLIVASALGKVAEKIINVLRIDQAVEKLKVGEKFKHAGFEIKVSHFFGELVKWFLILVFLMASTDILGLGQVTIFLNEIIWYVPNIVVATVILSIAFLLGNFVYHVVRSSTKVAGVISASLLAIISKWAIVIFGLLAALAQLGIMANFIYTIFTGLVAMLALAGGLAFGLGGKDEAALILKKLREELTEKS